MAYALAALAWIDPAARARLEAVGLRTSRQLLRNSGSPAQRLALERTLGISSERILVWTHRCDLLRLTGLGPVYVHLLAQAGVQQLAALAAVADAQRLTLRLYRTNARLRVTPAAPGRAQVAQWIDQARRVVPCVTVTPFAQPPAQARARRLAMQ